MPTTKESKAEVQSYRRRLSPGEDGNRSNNRELNKDMSHSSLGGSVIKSVVKLDRMIEAVHQNSTYKLDYD